MAPSVLVRVSFIDSQGSAQLTTGRFSSAVAIELAREPSPALTTNSRLSTMPTICQHLAAESIGCPASAFSGQLCRSGPNPTKCTTKCATKSRKPALWETRERILPARRAGLRVHNQPGRLFQDRRFPSFRIERPFFRFGKL